MPLLGFFTWKQQTHNNFCKRWTPQYQLTTTGAGSEGVYNLSKSYNSLRASPESKHQYWCLLFQCLCRDLCSRGQCAKENPEPLQSQKSNSSNTAWQHTVLNTFNRPCGGCSSGVEEPHGHGTGWAEWTKGLLSVTYSLIGLWPGSLRHSRNNCWRNVLSNCTLPRWRCYRMQSSIFIGCELEDQGCSNNYHARID